MKALREILASIEALKMDLEPGVDVKVEISVEIPLEDLEREG